MRLKDFFRLCLKNWAILILLPVATAVAVFFFTKKQNKEYSSDTVIYTGISSGFSLNKDNTNNYFASSKAFSNLLSLITSRETKQEVAIRLLAKHIMLKEYDSSIVSWNTYERLQDLISKPLRYKLVGSSLEETINNVNAYLQKDNTNIIFKLLNSEEPGYSLHALAKVTAYQIGGSDLMKVEYSSNDPAMCRQTLEILSEVFIRRHKDLMSSQNESVVNYFEGATEAAATRLKLTEQKLLDFHKKNDLINYKEKVSNIETEKQNLLQQYNALEMQYAGTVSALKAIETTLKGKGSSVLESQEIINLRNQLSKIKTEISDLESFGNGRKNTSSQARVSLLKQQAETIENKIRENMEVYFLKSHSVNGVASKDLLEQWIKNTVLVEEMKGQLIVMRRQNQNFGREYEKVAPLGADLKKIEREVEMAEKEYFSLLNGLGQSQLTQQNIEITSHLKVVDPAYTPIKANSSKRLLLILFGAAGTFFIALAGILTADLSFPILKNSYFASKHTGFPVFGAFPLINSKKEKDNYIFNKAEEQLAIQLILKKQELKNTEGQFVVGVLSSLCGEGKTTIIKSLTARLRELGIDTLNLFPSDHAKALKYNSNTLLYNPLKGINHNVTIPEISGKDLSKGTLAIIEFPALLESTYPVALLQQLDLILITIRADRGWKQADRRIVTKLKAVTDKPIEIILNGVLLENIEDLASIKLRPLGKESKEMVPSPAQENWQENMALNT